MSLRILRPGLMTTVQDRGRHGLQHLGVVPCGPMDPVALELANALVGNRNGEAVIEFTVLGPEIAFESDALVALCGALFEGRIDGVLAPANRPVLLPKNAVLGTGRALLGSRGYLAVAGGIATTLVLGSRSTYLPARFGGLEGRLLRAGDVLPLIEGITSLSLKRYENLQGRKVMAGLRTVGWSAPALTLPEREPIMIHAMEGRHYSHFEAASQHAFFDATWKVSPDSNRMGFRLAGPVLARAEAFEILSEPACFGTVQVPANGLPIALMADHQTTGGYPKIAEIAAADVPRLAQLAPGGSVQFARCTLEQARELRCALRQRVDSAVRSLAWDYQT
ncbi:MAG: biotin-dependent carboxyltransferase family protein [Betaproteobacteria bacterium]|nr:biotin-dependent carboxyltransferase family protein [Betaproteobacteria bacterium]